MHNSLFWAQAWGIRKALRQVQHFLKPYIFFLTYLREADSGSHDIHIFQYKIFDCKTQNRFVEGPQCVGMKCFTSSMVSLVLKLYCAYDAQEILWVPIQQVQS
jgi:hypothetical protein